MEERNLNLNNNSINMLILASMLYVGLMVINPMFGLFIVQVGPLSIHAGIFTSALCFLLIDILNELYPKQQVRKVLNLGTTIAKPGIYLLGLLLLALPVARYPEQHQLVLSVFKGSSWLIVAGIVANLISQHSSIYIYKGVAKVTSGKLFVMRNILGSGIGSTISTAVYILVGHGIGGLIGLMPPNLPLVDMILSGILIKLIFVLVLNVLLAKTIISILRKFGYVTLRDTKGTDI